METSVLQTKASTREEGHRAVRVASPAGPGVYSYGRKADGKAEVPAPDEKREEKDAAAHAADEEKTDVSGECTSSAGDTSHEEDAQGEEGAPEREDVQHEESARREDDARHEEGAWREEGTHVEAPEHFEAASVSDGTAAESGLPSDTGTQGAGPVQADGAADRAAPPAGEGPCRIESGYGVWSSGAGERPASSLSSRELGKRGEDAAARYLRLNGYEILERNWTCKFGEADIIARSEEGLVCFIEVKTRRSIEAGIPEEAVTPEKQRRYERIALSYLAANGCEEGTGVRFDAIGICVTGNYRALLRHHKGCFDGLF